jgi:hypothetical protein
MPMIVHRREVSVNRDDRYRNQRIGSEGICIKIIVQHCLARSKLTVLSCIECNEFNVVFPDYGKILRYTYILRNPSEDM